MAGLIPKPFIDELIARTDIAEIIGARVPLKKQGREYKACCPFHGEKTPSFWVSPEKQFYHCFGCGAHGTVIGFLINYDRMSFPEAVEDLAGRLGLEVPREGGDAPQAKRVDDSAYDLMSRVAQFYAQQLAGDQRVWAYATEKRGLTQDTIDRFGIGYAPNSWNDVLRRFGTTDAARQQLTELGLIIERDRGQVREGERHYDRFRDRLMFPIRDARGRVIAFGGRIIDQGEPKYLNSPETTLFHKGRELYGLWETRQSRAPLKRLVIVEGYMDTVRLHQYGITFAVATLGTATTPEHLNRMFRLVPEVVFAFDGDRAGRGAAWRALQHALAVAQEPREMRFLFLPEGHDPDSLVGEEGREKFEERLAGAEPLSEYFVRALAAEVDLTNAGGRARFAESARPLVAKMPAGIYRDLLIDRIAATVQLSRAKLEAYWSTSKDWKPDVLSEGGHGPNSGSRGSVIRQAVNLLLKFPEIAQTVTDDQRSQIETSDEPGADLLREMIDELRQHPAQSAGQVLQRWEGRPHYESLVKLLGREDLIHEPGTATQELGALLARVVDLAEEKRFRALSDRMQFWGLDALNETERIEYKDLIARTARRKPGR
jgi:DNA primase